MEFKRYNIEIFVRLLLVVVTCYVTIYLFQRGGYLAVRINLLAFIILQVYLLFRFLTRWQRSLKLFADSVRHGEYELAFRLIKPDDPFFQLYSVLNDVGTYVRKIKSEYVQQNFYFQYVVENAQVGLIVFQPSGKIVLFNQEVLAITGLSQFKRMADLKQFSDELYDQVMSLQLNNPKLVIARQPKSMKLSARLSQFIIDEKPVFLLSLLNIRPELEENELQSWQDLISVLTHEIMNSITPIHSLNGSMIKYLDKIEGNEEVVNKAKESLDVINRRSQMLMNFVERYRNISNVPLPHLQLLDISEPVRSVVTLLQHELDGIKVEISHHHEQIKADPGQIEQILINLIRNAIYSMQMSATKTINVRAFHQNGRTFLQVHDSGKGIEPELLDKIFIPFFTTRKEGSGIGLTLARQIMQRHGGTIEVASTPGEGSIFTLVFN